MAGVCSYLFFSGLVEICNDLFGIRETLCKCVVIGAGGVVAVTFTTGLLTLLGFTSSGIAAGSIAATIMSYLGVVEAGSLFAFLQSLGATGLTAGTGVTVASFGGWMGWMLSSVCGNQTQPQCDAPMT